MKLLMVDGDGAVMQEYGDVTAQIDGGELSGDTLMVRIPHETEAETVTHRTAGTVGPRRTASSPIPRWPGVG